MTAILRAEETQPERIREDGVIVAQQKVGVKRHVPPACCRADRQRVVRLGPRQVAVPMAKYLCVKGGFVRLAYQMRQEPSGERIRLWLVT